MPVRRIPIGQRSLVGVHNWDARASGVAFESALERDFITLMLFELTVLSIEEQPVQIRFIHEGAKRRYIPDFLIHFSGQTSRLIEIKYADELEKKADELAPKFDAADKYAKQQSWEFEVWTDINIRIQRLENAKFLLPFNRHEPDSGLAARVIRFFEDEKPHATVDAALNACWDDDVERARGRHALWALVAGRRLVTDFDQPLNGTTSLKLPEGSAIA